MEKSQLLSMFGCTEEEWQDYSWQVRSSVRSIADVCSLFDGISRERIRAIQNHSGHYRFSLMPYMFRYFEFGEDGYPDIEDPLTKLFFPGAGLHLSQDVSSYVAGEPKNWDRNKDFPLKNKNMMVLQHKYPDRALLRLSGCMGLCLYCFEAWRVLDRSRDLKSWRREWEAILDYLRKHKEVHEVVLSGGDPLAQTDESLCAILQDLRGIAHIHRIRINSAVFMHCPMRITPRLVSIFNKFGVTEIGVHALHPRQITTEFAQALETIGDVGSSIIQMRSQIPFLKDVNDNPDTFVELCNGLANCGISGYYLLHSLPWTLGGDRVRTPVWKMAHLLSSIKRSVSNIALPEAVLVARMGKKSVPLKRALFWLDRDTIQNQTVWAIDENEVPLEQFALKEEHGKYQFDGDVDFLYAEYRGNPVIVFVNWLRENGHPDWGNRWEMYLDKC